MSIIEQQKKKIDGMSHFELCEKWRYGKLGDPLLQGRVGKHFEKRLFDHFGGFTPEISKAIG